MHGVTILEWGSYLAVPLAGKLLSELGARVIKIESPDGDPIRRLGTVKGVDVTRRDTNLLFEAYNAGKESVCLDLRSEDGAARLGRLASQSAALITGYGGATAASLGCAFEDLHRRAPQLHYVRLSGYGADGEAELPAFDLAVQARSGFMQATADAVPHSHSGVADQMGGVLVAMATLALLAGDTEEGEYREVSMLSGMMLLQYLPMAITALTCQNSRPFDVQAPSNPLVNAYRCSDGKWICLAIEFHQDRYWPELCVALDVPELVGDERFGTNESRMANAESLCAILAERFSTRPAAGWIERLRGFDIVCSLVAQADRMQEDPDFRLRSLVADRAHETLGTLRLPATPFDAFANGDLSDRRQRAPLLGEDTDSVLLELARS